MIRNSLGVVFPRFQN